MKKTILINTIETETNSSSIDRVQEVLLVSCAEMPDVTTATINISNLDSTYSPIHSKVPPCSFARFEAATPSVDSK